jgi:MOSC domain-containing protein YiiM
MMDRLTEGMDSDGSDLKPTTTSAATIAGLASDGKHRFSKSQRESLVLLEGIGVEGDAHAGLFVRHRYLARRKPAMPNARQVHLIPVELFEALREENCVLGPGDLGENVLTAGLDLESLPLGTILKLGAEAAVELTGLRTPCVLIDRFRTGLSVS